MRPDQYLDALLTLPNLSGPALSPDGQFVAWTWPGVGPVANAFVAPTDGAAAPTQLTDATDNVQLVSWTRDSQSIVVRQDHGGDERAQLFQVDLDHPGVMRPLTEASPCYFLRGGEPHPNGRWLIYGANFDVAANREIEATWLYRHDLVTGERRPLARPAANGSYLPRLNEAGAYILYNRRGATPAGYPAWLVDIEGQADREILNFGPTAKVFASWFPDGQRVLFLAEAGTHRRLGVWELASGATRWLLGNPARNLERAFVPRGSDRAVIVEVRDARARCSLLDPTTGTETSLPDLPGSLVPLGPTGDGAWVGQYYSATQPTNLVRFSLDDIRPAAFVSLTRVWEYTPLRPDSLAPAEDFRWRADDGLEIQGWLYQPHGLVKGTIVFVHGGPTAHSEDRLNPQIQFLVAQGYTVLAPNYRGSTGFSLAYQEAIKADGWGGREQDDIRAGIEALIAAGLAERGKVGITGTSYGGYSSWCAITRWPRGLVAAAAPVCGMTDLVVDYQTTRPDLRPYSEEMLGGRPDQAPERYRERSPIHFVDQIAGQLLIVQGRRDPNVTPENVRVVQEALDRAGKEYELLAFDDEGHGIAQPKNRQTLYLRLVEFFSAAFAAAGEFNQLKSSIEA